MSISRFFDSLGAPLANPRWSWGAQRASDGVVFLRVWQDLKFVDEGRIHMLVDAQITTETDSSNPGYCERVEHINAVRAGATCFLVMCVAKDTKANPRKIKEFNDQELFVSDGLVERDGATWVRVNGRRPADSVMPTTLR